MILMYRNEDIAEVVFERKRVLVQMKAIKEEIFAKVEEVRRLAEKTGELAAFNITQFWRFAPENPQAVMLQERDRLQRMLTEMGIDESKVVAITSTITERIAADLATMAGMAMPLEAGPRMNRRDLIKKLADVLTTSEIGDAEKVAKAYLEPLDGWIKWNRRSTISNSSDELASYRA